jgi:hypothetical protein
MYVTHALQATACRQLSASVTFGHHHKRATSDNTNRANARCTTFPAQANWSFYASGHASSR